MTCKDCIHSEVCYLKKDGISETYADKCGYSLFENEIGKIDDMKKWLKPCYDCKYNPDRIGNDYTCAFDCDFRYCAYEKEEEK